MNISRNSTSSDGIGLPQGKSVPTDHVLKVNEDRRFIPIAEGGIVLVLSMEDSRLVLLSIFLAVPWLIS